MRRPPRSSEQLFFLAEDHQLLSYLVSLWVVTSAPDYYRAHQLTGQYHEAIGQDDKAIEEYRRALALKPDLQGLHFLIGNSYWRRGQLDEALPELQNELKV